MVIGVSGDPGDDGQGSPVGALEFHLTCHLMTDGEIDHEVNEMIKHLEQLRKKAKAMLAKHRRDEESMRSAKRNRPPADLS
jgi:hypothetical protein